ncbi:MAG TPA: hypothetical protein VI078_16910 [bacterium]
MPDPAELRTIEERVRAIEARTGVQVVVAALGRADVYHGLRWRAFAFGTTVAAALVALATVLRPGLVPEPAPFWTSVLLLAAGLLAALKTMLLPPVARLFLEPLRAEAEARQRAAALFLERGLFATRGRTGVLLLACAFERLAVVHADAGFRGRVAEEDWRSVELAIAASLRAGRLPEGLLAGLAALERLLVASGFAPAPGAATNELPDRPLTEADAR